ncbi:MAG: ABC transporter ATP-binding protein [Clostridium sp.]|jgi:iron complex transport system ATP-binding protein|nr:ABC transporter ATP-binding protein [Clostridium sp.]
MEIKNLQFAYDKKPVLTDINLTFPQGKFISILGPNGSGKSTLLKLILGLIKPDGGEITLEGRPVKDMKTLEKAKLLSYVPQSFQNSYEFTVEEVVSMGRYPFIKQFGNASKEDHKICLEAMELTETLRFKDQPVSRISGGELQRVSVARAIAQTTPWILLDEPVNHLDVSHQVGILKALQAMTPERTIITVMHDLNLARDFSDHVIMLHEGKVVKTGKPGECIDPKVLSNIYDLEFIKAHTADGSLQYLFPKTKP